MRQLQCYSGHKSVATESLLCLNHITPLIIKDVACKSYLIYE